MQELQGRWDVLHDRGVVVDDDRPSYEGDEDLVKGVKWSFNMPKGFFQKN